MLKGNNTQLKKSKSMCSLTEDNVTNDVTVYTKRRDNYSGYRRTESRTISDSSVDICVVVDSDSEDPGQNQLTDSGVADKTSDGDILQVLEQKIDRLSDMFLEQCRLLTTLKEDVRLSKDALEKAEAAQNEILTDLVNKAVIESGVKELEYNADIDTDMNSRAKTLLDAIEARQGTTVDREIINALASFLQSEELKQHMVAATAESVKDVIGDCISRDVSILYLPILEHSHRRLVRSVTRTVEEAFIELEENSACITKSVYKITKSLRRSIDRHQNLLEAAANPQKSLIDTLNYTVEEILHKELKQWRQKVLDVFSSHLHSEPLAGEELPDLPSPSLQCSPVTPPQPAAEGRSVIDQLMISAEICKQIEEGDVNGAFERALSAADLCVVTAACRSAAREHGSAFAPRCVLRPHVLLALLQQLSTDMLHDTHLKCRYLEDCIMNLDATNPATREHLPLVVGEVRKHLKKFLLSYPSHFASRRIALIIMAADNLLK